MRHGLIAIGWWSSMATLVVACERQARPISSTPREVSTPVPRDSRAVRPGIDVLLDDSTALLRGRRVGFVTNVNAVDRHGRSAIARLREANINLVALFGPEHGLTATAAPGEKVASTVDSATLIPIYSLYGQTRAPTAEMLRGIDLLLVDLPDVGARYYTWIATTVEVMKVAAPRGIPVVVLDRPNPITGVMQGNILDTAFASAVGRLAVPMRHGLTLGEHARLARHDLGIAVDLRVIPVAGWRRNVAFGATGLPFLPPSPNLRDLDALYHYPGTCLFEGTALSVGRGTDAAFHQVGAPWLDTAAVIARMRAAGLPGVDYRGVVFTPRRPGDSKFADTTVAGVRLVITDHRTYDPVRTAVHLLAAVESVHHDRIRIGGSFDRLAGGATLRMALLRRDAPDQILAAWQPALAAFRARVQPFLLYD